MKAARLLLVLTTMCLIAGCTQYWYQPGVSLQQAQTDRLECFEAVLGQGSINAMSSADIQAMNACMEQKGYTLVSAYQLPKTVEKANPVGSPYWKLNGVAGLPRTRDYPLFEY